MSWFDILDIIKTHFRLAGTNNNKSQMFRKVSIFMNVFNVHVNRIPISGKIVWLKYVPGTFFNASLDKASENNERMIIKIEVSKNN